MEDIYKKIEDEAMDNLVNGPQRTMARILARERKYREAFNRVLQRDGVVTAESLSREMGDPEVKRCPRIYISGPISGLDINKVRADFQRVENELISRGYEPVNPVAEADRHPEDQTTHQHMKRDIELLLTCDYIYMMRRWTHSKGCQVEFEVGTSIGLPVIFEENDNMTIFE